MNAFEDKEIERIIEWLGDHNRVIDRKTVKEVIEYLYAANKDLHTKLANGDS